MLSSIMDILILILLWIQLTLGLSPHQKENRVGANLNAEHAFI
jgi:nitrate reductase gamma subunit